MHHFERAFEPPAPGAHDARQVPSGQVTVAPLKTQTFEPNAIPCGVLATPNWHDASPQFLKTPVGNCSSDPATIAVAA
eukprot:914278-Prymnesium_polylepis.1